MIISGLNVNDVWPLLCQPLLWPEYYKKIPPMCAFMTTKVQNWKNGVRFYFSTFGFPVEAQVVEFVPPAEGKPARPAWHGWAGEKDTAQRLDVHHAWLLEDLSGHRVRILTQETQNGVPAKDLANTRPNPMLNGHQEWLDGLIRAAKK